MIKELVLEARARTKKGNPNFYKAFPPRESRLLREHYGERTLKHLGIKGCDRRPRAFHRAI